MSDSRAQIRTNRIPILGLMAEQSTSAPASPVEGLFWHDTANNVVKVYLSGTWVPISNNPTSLPPSGPAGGVLAGTYPNPSLAANGITDNTPFSAAMKDGAVGTATLRTIGTGAQQAMAGSTRLDTIAPPTTPVDANSQRIINVATPTASGDAVNKAYVDAARMGLDIKDSVRVASTANVTVTYSATGGTSGRGQITAAPNALDGVTLVAGNRILLKDQTTGAQNGIWVVTTLGTGANGVWDRATDFDADAEVTSGAFTFVEEGTTNDNSGWVLGTNNPITIGGASGTALAFSQFSGAGQITAGNGLTKTGNTLDVQVDNSTVEINADIVRVKDLGITGAKLATGAVDLAGTKVTGTLPLTSGGTGATTAAAARANLGASTIATFDNPALSAGVYATITHSLNHPSTRRPLVQIFDVASNEMVDLDVKYVDVNTIQIKADIAISASTMKITVVA